MNTRALVTWLSPLAVALLAFGSQIAFAQETSTLTRSEVRAEAVQAQQSGALERQRLTSYSTNPNWGPGASNHVSDRAGTAASRATAGNRDASPDVQSKKAVGTPKRDPA